jgi:hypothetical protein
MKFSILAAGILCVSAAVPASAQERGVSRRLFTFLDDEVTVEVTAESEGRLQIVRGEPGRLDVAARVPGGMSAFALGGRDGTTLRLTAVGGDNADFIVVVPEDTYLRVRLPNKKKGEIGSTRSGGTFTWPATTPAGAQSTSVAPIVPNSPTTAHASDVAPGTLNISRLDAVKHVTVRVVNGPFEVGGSRYMTVTPGNSQIVEIKAGAEPQTLFVNVPQGTHYFTLKLAGRTALVIRGAEVTAYCEPVVEQTVAGGSKWFTFTPEMGRVSCR